MEILDRTLKALADKNRLRILKLLEKKKMCVCELAYILGIAQPSVSKHLKKLISAGLIEREQDGFWTNYYLKKDNQYSKALLRNLKLWLNEDETIKEDLKKAKKANRAELFSKR
ncbi:MAG: ArsR/SmtB family transcription factor [bacterium]